MSNVFLERGADLYFERAQEVFRKIQTTQLKAIREAAERMADSVAKKRWIYLFGSGHSVLPVLDIFPRYGSFVGFYPLMDPRLMWWNVMGAGGAPGLLWLERQEGYLPTYLDTIPFTPDDTLLVYSHGGLNAAPIEAGLYARERGCTVIAVTSMANHEISEATHSTGRKLADVADIVIDNCVPPRDALVDLSETQKVAAGSTLSVITISMALVAETAAQLQARGVDLDTFVSPNVPGIEAGHNQKVFERFRQWVGRTVAAV